VRSNRVLLGKCCNILFVIKSYPGDFPGFSLLILSVWFHLGLYVLLGKTRTIQKSGNVVEVWRFRINLRMWHKYSDWNFSWKSWICFLMSFLIKFDRLLNNLLSDGRSVYLWHTICFISGLLTEVVRFCAASSIWSVDLSQIFSLVVFSRFFEKELQLTKKTLVLILIRMRIIERLDYYRVE